MNNIHILIHRWFSDGEGWAYDSCIPEDARTLMTKHIAEALRQCHGNVHETQIELKPGTLYVRIEPDRNCTDTRAQERHPHFDIGIIMPSHQKLPQEEIHRIVESASQIIQTSGAFPIQKIYEKAVSSTAPSKPTFSCCSVFLLLMVLLLIGGSIAGWRYLSDNWNNVMKTLSLEAGNSHSMHTQSEDNEKDVSLKRDFGIIDTADDANILKRIAEFESKYTLKAHPNAEAIFNQVSQKKQEAEGRIAQKLNGELENYPNDELSTDFAKVKSNAEEREKIFQKYAACYPESSPQRGKLLNRAIKEKQLAENKIIQNRDGELAKYPNDELSTDFAKEKSNAEKRQTIYEKYAGYFPESDPQHEELQKKATEEKQLAEDMKKYVPLKTDFDKIENAGDSVILEQIAQFEKKYTLKDYPKAKDLFGKVSQKKQEAEERIAQSLNAALAKYPNDVTSTDFGAMKSNAEKRQTIYKKYARYFPESSSQWGELQDKIAKEKQLVQDWKILSENIVSRKNDTVPTIEEKYQKQIDIYKKFQEMLSPDSSQYKKLEDTISDLEEKLKQLRGISDSQGVTSSKSDESQPPKQKEETIDLSDAPATRSIDRWELNVPQERKRELELDWKKLNIFIGVLNQASELQKKCSQESSHPDIRFLKLFPKHIELLPDQNPVSKKLYDDKIEEICEQFKVSEFDDIGNAISFKKFFEKEENNKEVTDSVPKEVCDFVRTFCPASNFSENAEKLYNFLKDTKQLRWLAKEDFKLRPEFVIWSFFQTIKLPITSKQAVEMLKKDKEKQIVEQIEKSYGGIVFSGENLNDILQEYSKIWEVFNRVEGGK